MRQVAESWGQPLNHKFTLLCDELARSSGSTGNYYQEQRQYNSRLQLTRITGKRATFSVGKLGSALKY